MKNLKKPKIDLIFQVCVVTDNLDRTLENWKKTFDFDNESIKMKYTEEEFRRGTMIGHNYYGQPCEWQAKCARFDIGGIDFELIEPLDKKPDAPFSDFLIANGGQGLHHIGVKISNMEAFETKMKELGVEVMNWQEIGEPLSNGAKKGCKFYDLRPQLGCILECCSVVVGPRAGEEAAGNPPEMIPEKKNDFLFGFQRDETRTAIDLIFQICVCVENLHETMANWKEIFDFDEGTIVLKSTKKAFEEDDWNGLNYNEKKCGFFHQYYRFSIGNLDLEIIEPFDKNPGNPYSDFLIEHGRGLHHLGVKIGNLKQLMDDMKRQGIPRFNYAEMGPVLADGSRKACVFYDLRPQLGCIFECGSVVVGPLATDPRAGNPSDFVSD